MTYSWSELVALHRERSECDFDGINYRSHTCAQSGRKKKVPEYVPVTPPDAPEVVHADCG